MPLPAAAHFHPRAQALTDETARPPIPGAPVLDNISKFYRIVSWVRESYPCQENFATAAASGHPKSSAAPMDGPPAQESRRAPLKSVADLTAEDSERAALRLEDRRKAEASQGHRGEKLALQSVAYARATASSCRDQQIRMRCACSLLDSSTPTFSHRSHVDLQDNVDELVPASFCVASEPLDCPATVARWS